MLSRPTLKWSDIRDDGRITPSTTVSSSKTGVVKFVRLYFYIRAQEIVLKRYIATYTAFSSMVIGEGGQFQLIE